MSDATLHQLEWGTGRLASDVVSRLEEDLPWFATLGPDQRAAVGLIVQSGVREFVRWCRAYQPDGAGQRPMPSLRAGDLFVTAPRQLVAAITLQQTVELVRMAVDTCEEGLLGMLPDEEAPGARELLLRYAREVAFTAADVYARAAEVRGTWDARLESLVVDAVVRGDEGDALASQASALSWDAERLTSVVVAESRDHEAMPATWRRIARDHDADIITGRHVTSLVCVVGGPSDPMPLTRALLPVLGPGAVVVGPTGPGLSTASRSAREALSALASVRAWPEAPRPVAASQLLPERVLAGDADARAALVASVWDPLEASSPGLVDTLDAYLGHGGTLEATARQLFVHPNTVRYRLGRIADLTGLHPADARDRWTLQVGLAAGRLDNARAARSLRAGTAMTSVDPARSPTRAEKGRTSVAGSTL